MPISYTNLPLWQLIAHQKVFEVIERKGPDFYDNWDLHNFEGACIQNTKYGSIEKWRAFKQYISADLKALDSSMPLLRFREPGQHYCYELFLLPPSSWGSRGAPGFWNKVSRAFSEDKLPCSKEYFIEKYMDIVNQYGIPFGEDEYINIPEFDHGGMSVGSVGGYFAEYALEILLNRLEHYLSGEKDMSYSIDDYKDRMSSPVRMIRTNPETREPYQSCIRLVNGSCVEQTADAVVNAANKYLAHGAGICGVIFDKANSQKLTAACNYYDTPLKDGQVAITPAFDLYNFKNIIHAVGPDFRVTPKAFKELFEAYYNSLIALKDNGLHSISFPLISAGIFGGNLPHPAEESAKQALRAYNTFRKNFPDYDIEVMVCAFTSNEQREAAKIL